MKPSFNINEYKKVPASVELFDAADFDMHLKAGTEFDAEFSDADLTAFFNRSLLYILQNTKDTKQKELKAATLFPVSREVDPGADTFVYQKYTMYGTAKAIADYAEDFPRADVYGEEVSATIKGFGVSYGWSVQEIRRNALAARTTGRDPRLTDRKAMAARRAADEVVNTAALEGFLTLGIPGFINFPGTTEAVNPGGTTFANKTPDEIIATLSAHFSAVSVPTNGREVPDTYLCPLTQFNILRHTRIPATGVSLLSYLRDNFPEITKWEWLQELDGAGAAGSDRAFMYPRDSQNLELHLPLPFTTYTAQVKNLEWVIPCEVRTGGVLIYYPLSVAYMDGI
ncbi:MAG: DUF2184 domain-containing protein [Deltaproteobacteria bacterium]|nr:DUF2184 domain-containing protein [Deltaproteobacteria bacterium]